MTEPNVHRRTGDHDPFLLAQVNLLLRWRGRIVALGLAGAVIGLASGLLRTRVYASSATFLPQASDANTTASSLALAASQLGVRLPTATASWGPPVYVELLRSRALLAPIVVDTFEVTEEQGRRVTLMDVLEVQAPSPQVRIDRAVIRLRNIVAVRELKPLTGVELSVTTKWPSVSYAVALRLVESVQRFNVETRKSQAAAERQFVEARALEAERALREAEDRMQSFLTRNRTFAGSPELVFQRDRLQRDVGLRQQIYTTLLQGREEARVREVRDTPVITVLEAPRLPVLGESRRTALKGALGMMAGGILGLVFAFLSQGLAAARQAPSEEASEFFRLLEQATPRFLRRRAR